VFSPTAALFVSTTTILPPASHSPGSIVEAGWPTMRRANSLPEYRWIFVAASRGPAAERQQVAPLAGHERRIQSVGQDLEVPVDERDAARRAIEGARRRAPRRLPVGAEPPKDVDGAHQEPPAGRPAPA
jgi:hypothetical protein